MYKTKIERMEQRKKLTSQQVPARAHVCPCLRNGTQVVQNEQNKLKSKK